MQQNNLNFEDDFSSFTDPGVFGNQRDDLEFIKKAADEFRHCETYSRREQRDAVCGLPLFRVLSLGTVFHDYCHWPYYLVSNTDTDDWKSFTPFNWNMTPVSCMTLECKQHGFVHLLRTLHPGILPFKYYLDTGAGSKIHLSATHGWQIWWETFRQLIFPSCGSKFDIQTRTIHVFALGVGGKSKNKTKQKQPNNGMQSTAIKGKGDYKAAIMDMVKPVMTQALQAGMKMGRSAIKEKVVPTLRNKGYGKLGDLLSQLAGRGDYTMGPEPTVNALINGNHMSKFAQFSNNGMGTTIMHREYVQDVFTGSSAGAFNLQAWNINPGLFSFSPYMANIAQNYEEYRIKGLVVECISTTSEFATAGAMGSWMVSMEYNASNPLFTSKTQLENSGFAVSDRFDRSLMFGVECASNVQNSYYVRSGASSLPSTTTDLGILQIATQPSASFPTSSNVGEVWISFIIEFYRPRISPSRFGYFHTSWTNSQSAASLNSTFLGTNNSTVVYGSMTGTKVISSSQIQFTQADIGDIYAVQYMVGSNPAELNNAISITTYVGFIPLFILNNYSSPAESSNNSSEGVLCVYYQVSTQEGSGTIPYLGFGQIGISAASVINVDVIIINVGNGFGVSTL
jgi:hypothetical protein